jgi:hypothetical protein
MKTLTLTLCLLLPVGVAGAQSIVADHSTTDISQIPAQWITQARENVAWVYLHTSHGSQLESGADYLRDYVDSTAYNFLSAWETIPPQTTPTALREAEGSWYWQNADQFYVEACALLDNAHAASTYRVFLWSWCGEMSSGSTDVQGYLDRMVQLQGEYPDVIFVFMTGHTDEWNDAQVKLNNDIVRNHVANNGGFLFDFADMERNRPDGTPCPGTADDGCPWCPDWCTNHPEDCPSPAIDCSHSHSLLCYLKGQAWWWLSARIAGWEGSAEIFSDGFEDGSGAAWSGGP